MRYPRWRDRWANLEAHTGIPVDRRAPTTGSPSPARSARCSRAGPGAGYPPGATTSGSNSSTPSPHRPAASTRTWDPAGPTVHRTPSPRSGTPARARVDIDDSGLTCPPPNRSAEGFDGVSGARHPGNVRVDPQMRRGWVVQPHSPSDKRDPPADRPTSGDLGIRWCGKSVATAWKPPYRGDCTK